MSELTEVQRDFLARDHGMVTFFQIATVEALEAAGLIEVDWDTKDEAHREFGVWWLTGKGRAALAGQPAAADALPASDGDAPDRDALLEALREHAAECERRAEAAEADLAIERAKTSVLEWELNHIRDRIFDYFESEGEPFANAKDAVESLIEVHDNVYAEYVAYVDEQKAALRQEREAHRALLEAARACVADDFPLTWVRGKLRTALAALPEATAPDAGADDAAEVARLRAVAEAAYRARAATSEQDANNALSDLSHALYVLSDFDADVAALDAGGEAAGDE